MPKNLWLPVGIALLSVFALWVVWPQVPSNYFPSVLPWPERGWIQIQLGDFSFVRKGMTLGLDLQGGTDLVLQADLSQQPVGDRQRALEGVKQVIERRVNAFGVTESVIQVQGQDRLSVQLPGVKNVDEAKALIGKTAQLDFREGELDVSGQPVLDENRQPKWKKATAKAADGTDQSLTGAYFKPNATVTFDNLNKPQVSFELTNEGAVLFEQITNRLIQKPLGIFLDDQLISAPIVQAVIRSNGVITGIGALQEAQILAIQLNAGALPVPVSVIKETDVDASLGADSVRKSIVAGEIGFVAVLLFMALNYRLPGLIAGIALVNYAIYVLALFKLIPVTLTLAGIAAFILSVGMAVDANILIFERMKEEVRIGRTVASAIEAGFDRAWPSIRDSNVSTFISCAILFWFGNSFGASLVMGFALTLAIGVAVSMFSAVTVTRLLLRLFVGTRSVQQTRLLGMD